MSEIIFLDASLASFLNKGRVYVLWIACSLLQAIFFLFRFTCTTSPKNYYRHKLQCLYNKTQHDPILEQEGVCHTVALPRTLKSISMQKKNQGNSNFIIIQKSSKRNPNPSRYYNSITNLKFQHQPKISSFKNTYIKIDLLLPRGQNPLSYYTL